MKKNLFFLATAFFLFCCGHLKAQSHQAQLQERMKIVKIVPSHFNPAASRTSAGPHGSASNTSSCTVDTIILTSQAAIDNFSTNYPTCTTPKYLFINGQGASPAITNLNGLSSLTEVQHVLDIRHTSITNLNPLNNLANVGDTLWVEDNPLLTQIHLYNLDNLGALYFHNLPLLSSIDGLTNNLDSIGGFVHIDSTAITSLSGFANLRYVLRGFAVAHSPITTLSALTKLEVIQDYLYLDSDSSLTSIGINTLKRTSGFLFSNVRNLSNLGPLSHQLTNTDIGTFWMIQTGISDLSGLDSLTSAGNFYIWLNDNITSLHGLEKLSGNLDGGLSIWLNQQLTDISALKNITSTDHGKVEVANCPVNTLNGLQNITSIGRGLWINSTDLTSLDSLNNALVIHNFDTDNDGNPDSLRIFDNTQLALCSSQPICYYLNTDGRAFIDNNAPGCATLSEVLATCSAPCPTPDQKTWNGSNSDDWNDAANWTPAGIPGPCTRVTIPASGSVPNDPHQWVNDLNIGGLVMESGSNLWLNNHNLVLTNTLSLDGASIYNGSNITANKVYAPRIWSSYIEGNFNCLDYGGHSEFAFNNFDGNTTFSDSVGRTEGTSAIINNFYGNLSWINNSDYGQSYLSNASPGHDYIQGNLTVINNSTADISVGLGGGPTGNPIEVHGDFTATSNSGRIDVNNFNFVGDGNSHFTQGGTVPITIEHLSMTKFGGNLTLNNDLRVHNQLDFAFGGGAIVTGVNKLLILENNCTINHATFDGSGVVGPMKKIGNQPFTFPLNTIDTSTNTFWTAYLTMTAPALPTDEFTAEYLHHDPSLDGYDTAQYNPGFGGVQGKEFWKLDRNNGNSKVKVTLSYDSLRSGPDYLYQYMQVANWDTNKWRSLSTSGFSGTIAAGSILSGDSTAGGPLTLSYKPVRKPVITIGNLTDSLPCLSTPFYVRYTADTAMISGNTMSVQVSDTLGNFNNFFNPSFGNKLTSAASDSIQFFSTVLLPNKDYKIRIVGNLPSDTSINTKTVRFVTGPQPSVAVVGPNPACLGTGVQKYYPSFHEAGVTYTWSLPNGGGTFTTSGDTALVSWTSTGNYNVFLTVSNKCNSFFKNLLVEVKPAAPTAIAVINNTGRWLYCSQVPATAGYSWYRNGTLISGASSSSYYASQAGSYTAKFANFCGAGPSSNVISFASNSLPQSITFPPIGNKTYGDAPFVPAATASSGLPVSFSIVSGPATINTQTNMLTITGTGPVTVKANQPGDNVYDTAAPVSQSFTVNKATQTINFPTISDQNFGTGTVSLTASASSGLPVTYSIVSGPAIVGGNIVTLNGVGTVTVRATQTGDTNYLSATSVDRSFCSRVASLNPISGFTNLCPSTAVYSVNNIPGATYSWRIAGGSTLSSTTNTVSINWTTPGLYTLLVSASGNCGAPSINDTLLVNVINSIQPDSVQSMFPPNNAINQELPLTLSWVPAQPNAFYTFDLYLWKAEDPQPATPYAANITTVNYTLPVNSGLLYNHPYKWMIVSHNGSCTVIQTGPVQQFTLIPLPDLVVSNVQAPTTAFSGQTISINWKVSNPGPGKTTTNQHWTDAVFLSFDSIPNFAIPPQTSPGFWNNFDFPVRPLLVGTKPNVSALDSGQFYTNSINFTLPLNYSQQMYAYVIANYPDGAAAPVQVTKVNDTARAPQPIIVTLSPAPDLRVDTVFTPATTFSGSTINVTYKVKNYGVLTPAGSNWADNIYISQSPFFNINTAIPVKYPKPNGTYYANAQDAIVGVNTQLQADSFYTKNVQVVIPNFFFGTYFIYVVTNAGNSVYEGTAGINNANRSQLQVFLTPTPHLTVSSLTVPFTTVSITQPVSVNWIVSNTGFNDNIEKNKGHYFVKAGDCLIPPPPCPVGPGICIPPPPTPGITLRDSTDFGGSFWTDKVYLSTDSSVLNTATAILLTQNNQGIQNSGLMISDNYSNALSEGCKPLSTIPGNFNANTSNVIKPASSHAQTGSFNIPANLPSGNYYIYVFANANKDVYEYPGLPETRRSALPLTVQRPDAAVSTISAPSTAQGGQPITINYGAINNGPGAVFNSLRKDRLYISSSPVFDGSAQVVATQSFTENMPVGSPIVHSFNYVFPVATSGTRYFYVQTNYDSSFREDLYTNNTSIAAAITISPATATDLVVSSIQLADTVYTSYNTYFKYRVVNNAAGTTAGTWTDSIFISCNSTFSNNTAYYIGKRSHSEILHNGESYADSFYISIPYSFLVNSCFPTVTNSNAYFFIKANADNVAYEGLNTNNNITGTGQRVLINPIPDHIVTIVTAGDTATVGRPYQVNWSVKNIGYNPNNISYYYLWNDGVLLSPDSVYNGNAVLADYFTSLAQLNPNQTYSESRSITVPNIPPGDYYVMARSNISNQIVGEVTTNNANVVRNALGAAKKIHVVQPLLPDLTDSILSVNSPVATGQLLNLVYKVSNKGAGPTFPSSWSNDVWLSSDFIPGNSGDIKLSGNTHAGALAAGQSYNDTSSLTIPLSIVPGNYVLIVNTNPGGNVTESNFTNNLAFRYVTIFRPAPADLVVQQIMKPDTVMLGYTLDTAKWVIRNNAPNNATGISSDGIYLSKNNTLDSTALLLGVKAKTISMGPLSNDTISLTPLVNNVVEGDYYLLVKTDLLNNIYESDKTNNTGVAAGQVHVSVKELPLNVLTPNTLSALNRYYKLIIPDSLNGATIQVILKSNDSLSMKNQIFIGKGYIPTPANFDYTYTTPNYGNQDIVMSSVTPGTYYINVRCVSTNAVVQNITLKAVKLPFTILNVNAASGGNTGNVTIRINGSLFTSNMTATLSKPGTTITASAVYFTNSTQVYATFNLQGKPLGIYDVTLSKPDTSFATLPGSFSVVNPNNGGLITGGGVNTGSGNGNSTGCDPGAASGLNSQLVTELVIPDKVFAGWPFVIQLNFTNPTNVDVPAQTRTLFADNGALMSLIQANLPNGTSTLYLEITEPGGPPGIIRAGGSGTITIYTKSLANTPGHTHIHFTLQ